MVVEWTPMQVLPKAIEHNGTSSSSGLNVNSFPSLRVYFRIKNVPLDAEIGSMVKTISRNIDKGSKI